MTILADGYPDVEPKCNTNIIDFVMKKNSNDIP